MLVKLFIFKLGNVRDLPYFLPWIKEKESSMYVSEIICFWIWDNGWPFSQGLSDL